MLTWFFDWYNRNYKLTLRLTAVLFLLQIIHLIWLTSNVVVFRLFGVSFFPHWLDGLVAIVDYTEIPALISVSLVYVNEIFIGRANTKTWLYLFLLNTQWLHLFWITDEVVVANFTGQAAVAIPLWLAWIGISIDYLEIPVMWDTIKKTLHVGRNVNY